MTTEVASLNPRFSIYHDEKLAREYARSIVTLLRGSVTNIGLPTSPKPRGRLKIRAAEGGFEFRDTRASTTADVIDDKPVLWEPVERARLIKMARYFNNSLLNPDKTVAKALDELERPQPTSLF